LRSHLHTLSLEVTGVAKQQQSEDGKTGFPFITIPMFEVSAHQMRERSGLEMIVFSPLVELNQTDEWILFSQTQFNDWYRESIEYHAYSSEHDERNSSTLHVSTYDANSTVPGAFWFFSGNSLSNAYPVEGDGPFLPAWLTSPPPFSPRLINFDALQIPYVHRMLPLLRQTRDILLSEVSDGLQASIGTSVSQTDHQAYHDRFTTQMEGTTTPASMAATTTSFFPPHALVLQPVWDTLYHDDGNDPATLVGLVSGIVAWDFYVAGLLPEDTSGIYVVLKNSCGQSYTYLLNGPKVRMTMTSMSKRWHWHGFASLITTNLFVGFQTILLFHPSRQYI
jgi:hypothetical protein